MPNALMVAAIALSGLTVFFFSPVGTNLASIIMATDMTSDACIAALKPIHPNIASVDKRDINILKLDINGDGENDRVIKISDTPSCGTSGCITEICLTSDSNVQVLPFGFATSDFEVLQTRTESYHDILINRNVTMRWDGARYTLFE